MSISIEGLDKAAVLVALYDAAQQVGLGMFQSKSPMSIDHARALLKQQTDFDYVNGCALKVNLSGDTLETWLYNRDQGDGAAERIINKLRDRP